MPAVETSPITGVHYTSEEVIHAYKEIHDFIDCTPLHKVEPNSALAKLVNARVCDAARDVSVELYFKLENLQRTNSFKIRGLMCCLSRMSDERLERGIVVFSTGNHAFASGYAASLLSRMRGVQIPVHAFMPPTASKTKVYLAESQGVQVHLSGNSVTECMQIAEAFAESLGTSVLAPADDYDIIRGHGSVGIEIIDQMQKQENFGATKPDAIFVPTSGAALLAGTAVYCQPHGVNVYGTEPAKGSADLLAGRKSGKRREMVDSSVNTIADGLRSCVAPRAWPVVSNKGYVRDVFGVNDEQIREALKFFVTETKTLAETSGVVPLAALLFSEECKEELKRLARNAETGKLRLVVVVTGGNVSLEAMVEVLMLDTVRNQ
ncbi:serine racemase [Nannizzia gypsea CBS 118893]|uniref:Serine racemase n=1 Tax=Arthroderma gypseum (strain ATCC MYA-4604 / CBS 118893) TaxID=535722 RepID=E4UQ89_ARTGP|nr:serine racemase [Nannizzia gypsea CBS 118893]EFQ99170.1 serine racemase [Nannizzia gypsea CBS 118893]